MAMNTLSTTNQLSQSRRACYLLGLSLLEVMNDMSLYSRAVYEPRREGSRKQARSDYCGHTHDQCQDREHLDKHGIARIPAREVMCFAIDYRSQQQEPWEPLSDTIRRFSCSATPVTATQCT